MYYCLNKDLREDFADLISDQQGCLAQGPGAQVVEAGGALALLPGGAGAGDENIYEFFCWEKVERAG